MNPVFGYYVDGELRGINLGMEELGGIEPYYQRFKFHTLSNHNTNNPYKIITTAPTFSQAFRWFREKYEFQSEVTAYGTRNGYSYLFKILVDSGSYHKVSDIIDCYEEAELECLKKLIKIAKSK